MFSKELDASLMQNEGLNRRISQKCTEHWNKCALCKPSNISIQKAIARNPAVETCIYIPFNCCETFVFIE
jgi:hypothetical protein